MGNPSKTKNGFKFVRVTKRAGKTEWAHALAGGLSAWGVGGSLG